MQIKYTIFVKNISIYKGDCYMGYINLGKYNIRTDLIIDDDKIIHNEENINGIIVNTTKKDGNYITISFDDITDSNNFKKVREVLTNNIKKILKLNNVGVDSLCLVIGLGNRLSTPDSLGVKVLDNIVITEHIYKLGNLSDGMMRVCAFSPGVMGNTGIESSVIIKSLIEKVKPDIVIIVDALASRSIDRINKTIQITDTGIHPGSGIGNDRKEVSKKTMGIPVIAIGVPTVMMSSVIVYDTINYLYKHISYIKEYEGINKLSFNRFNYKDKLKDRVLNDNDKSNLLGLFGGLDDISQRELIDEVLNNTELNLIVTPTEIDFLINKLSKLIADSINLSLHRQITY